MFFFTRRLTAGVAVAGFALMAGCTNMKYVPHADPRKSDPSFNIVVMSLKMMPGFGKSGTSRMVLRKVSTTLEFIGATLPAGRERSISSALLEMLQRCEAGRWLLT
jgi:hypothetical protein